MAHDCDEVVIGAGAIGLAVARARARAGTGADVVVLEAEGMPLLHASSRNSEVVHAGLYYTPGSWKARLCVAGRRRLYDYLADREVAHRRCGKLVVAVDAGERTALAGIADTARANGVEALGWLEGRELAERAPAVRAVAALESPTTGIFDSHGFALALLADAEAAGCTPVYHQRVTDIERRDDGVVVTTADSRDGSSTALACRRAFNCAGPGAVAVYHRCRGLGPRRSYQAGFAKGNYAAVSGPPPAPELVYPVPQAHGLGVHVTLDLAGRVRLGPDVQWVETPDDYAVDAAFAERARAAAARYWPAIAGRDVRPDYAGIRPRVARDGAWLDDFVFELDPPGAGDWRVAHCLGIESPGLTAALAIADMLSDRVASP